MAAETPFQRQQRERREQAEADADRSAVAHAGAIPEAVTTVVKARRNLADALYLLKGRVQPARRVLTEDTLARLLSALTDDEREELQ
jgi:hypothetical protein